VPDELDAQLNDRLRLAREQRVVELAAIEAREQKEREDAREQARYRLVERLDVELGITVPVARVELVAWECEETRYDGDVFAEVRIGGTTFSFRRPNRWRAYGDDVRELCVLRRCTKGCTHPLWIDIETMGELLFALEDDEMQHHLWPCRVEYDVEGRPETDDQGVPLPKPKPSIDWEARHNEAVKAYQSAVEKRRTLEFSRPIAKAVAIQRLIDEGRATSATAAERIVETDAVYALHCQQLTHAVVDEIGARERVAIARFHAGYQIDLQDIEAP
jgi:hypothetical protein